MEVFHRNLEFLYFEKTEFNYVLMAILIAKIDYTPKIPKFRNYNLNFEKF